MTLSTTQSEDPVKLIESGAPQTTEMRLAAVRMDGDTLMFIPESERTAQLCLAAVQSWGSGGSGLRFVPEAMRTDALCLSAVLTNAFALQYVPMQTPGLCMAALQKNLHALQFVKDQTPELCAMAIEKKGWALKHIREASQTEELCAQAIDKAVDEGVEVQHPLLMVKDEELRAKLAARYNAPCPATPAPTAARFQNPAQAAPTPAPAAQAHVPAPSARKKRGANAGQAAVAVAAPALAHEAAVDDGAPAEAASRDIDPAVMAVLRECTADDKAVFLPPAQLDPKLYKKVNEVLAALGGKWDRFMGGHKFSEDPREVLAAVQATGKYMSPKDFGFFPTPKPLAERAVALLDLAPGMWVLEPRAGMGAWANAAAAIVGIETVHTVEYLEKNREVLRSLGYQVIGRDFLAIEPSPVYDVVIMNPPFGLQADMKHIEHAARFLKPDGRLVAIMSPSYQIRSTKVAESFRELMAAAGDHEEEIAAGTFRESGTDVRTVLISMDASRMPWNRDAEIVEAQHAEPARQRQRAA